MTWWKTTDACACNMAVILGTASLPNIQLEYGESTTVDVSGFIDVE